MSNEDQTQSIAEEAEQDAAAKEDEENKPPEPEPKPDIDEVEHKEEELAPEPEHKPDVDEVEHKEGELAPEPEHRSDVDEVEHKEGELANVTAVDTIGSQSLLSSSQDSKEDKTSLDHEATEEPDVREAAFDSQDTFKSLELVTDSQLELEEVEEIPEPLRLPGDDSEVWNTKEYPYGPKFENITHTHLKEIAYELGLIKLCWPENALDLDLDTRKHYPSSYVENSKKEKLLLWYAENARRQYHFVYPDRKPLLLAAKNECGLQKMVCTTIRPTVVHYPEFYTWQGCADFIADHIKYEYLEKVVLMPEQLKSPSAVLTEQRGNCFEVSTMLCSYLIGSGYDAYVVSGYATREVCLNDQTRVICPFLSKEGEDEASTGDVTEPKYSINPPRDLRSKFLIEMEMREVRKREEEERKLKEAEQKAIEDFERPGPDDFYGVRVHSWIVVLPGSREIEEPFFIESASGVRCEIDHPNYLGLESLWNHTNYWVNLQCCSEGCKNLKFDLTDISCWEHLLPGEPWQTRKMEPSGEEDIEVEIVLQEKHLDMPMSWVTRLDIPNATYENRFPDGSRMTMYKKCKLEQFAPYLQRDGLIRRVTTYSDYDWENALIVYEYYTNRADYLEKINRDLKSDTYIDFFIRGREDALNKHTYIVGDNTVEGERTLEFYQEARVDGLEKLEMNPLFLKEYFKGRDDLLFFRHAEFAPRKGVSTDGIHRTVLKVTERFHRNPSKNASQDIADQVFAIADNEIHVKYHYEEGRVTATTRDFIKPPLAEMGERMTFNPDLTCGYQVDPSAPAPKQVDLFLLLQELLQREEYVLYHIREIEAEVGAILRNRSLESAVPKLNISIFDKERNEKAKQGLKEQEEEMREKTAREVEADVDFLAPYIARLSNPILLTQKQALQVREECLSDYKQMLVDRANHFQAFFEEQSNILQEKHHWYEEVQDTLTREEEELYFDFVNKTSFLLHTLEIRLSRHRDLAPKRYLALEACLRSDSRLAVLYY